MDCAGDGARAEFLGATEQYDAVVLDLGLPAMDGLTLLRRWREAGVSVPVLVLTARGSWHEKVAASTAAPTTTWQSPSRWRKCWRGCGRSSGGRAARRCRRSGAARIVLDPRAARVTVHGAPVRLTSHEFRVLSYLMHHRGCVVSQGELAEHIYARDADRDSNTVEVFIARLRKKVGAAAIATVRGLGYRMEGG